jgi:hypothetical protein
MNSSNFVHHEPCPKCGSRDNLGVWDDGHKWCFGCGFYVPPPDSIINLKRRITMENNNKNADSIIDCSLYTTKFPEKVLTWLKKYGISDIEIQHYGLMYNEATFSLVFPCRDDKGIFLTSERYFGPDPNHPKYVTIGRKTKPFVFVNKNVIESLIMVEDYVSAIKVGRFATCAPLFGATIPANTLKWAVERFKKVRIWLDMDKATQSLREASKASQFCQDVRSIITTLDPKEYTNTELVKILKTYGVLTNT